MPPVRIIFPGRSDGIGTRPNDEQMERKVDGKTTQFYREVKPHEDKARDWRRKLGGMLVQQMEKKMSAETGTKWKADKDSNMTYMLYEFPSGYNLYEHHTIHEGEGTRDRRDTYLYGHPGGTKKRFRTPKEFFLHLWWLLTDEDGTNENCACKLCISDELLREIEAFMNQTSPKDNKTADAAPSTSKAKAKTKTTPADSPASKSSVIDTQASVKPPTPTTTQFPNEPIIRPAPLTQNRPVLAPQTRPTNIAPAFKSPQSRPSSSGRPAPQSRLAPSEIPVARSLEQREDTSYGSYLFRIGEIVWYTKMQSVGLAVISGRSKRVFVPSQSSDPFFYTLRPLSYPSAVHETKIENEALLKPWYAYSPPSPTHTTLNRADILQRPFNGIDWNAVLAGTFGPGDTDVDASIFAARTIDRSYTPIECINNTGTQLYYNGIYLGAEKIWRGDAVTLRSHQPTTANLGQPLEILIVTDIVETMQAAGTPPGQSAPPNSVHLIGDKYTFSSNPIPIPPDVTDVNAFLSSRVPTRIPILPDRVAEDLMFQNRTSVLRKQMANSWRLTAAAVWIGAAEVRGRWYETSRMMPIISPSNFQRMRDITGEIHDVGRSLNARGEAADLGQIGSPGMRFTNRLEVLGRSVPHGFKLEVDN